MYNVYNEVDLSYVFKSTISRVNFLKSNNILVNKPRIRFYFFYNKVSDPDLEKVYENLLLLWFFTGHKLKVGKIKTKLIRGFRYYWFYLQLDFFFNNSFFKFYESLFYSLKLFISNKNFFYIYDDNNLDNFYYQLYDVRGFNNIRLSDYFYLVGIYKSFLIHFFTKNNNKYFNYFLSSYYFLSLLKGVKS